MGNRITGSKALAVLAKARGFPEQQANRFVTSDSQGREFWTVEDVKRQSETIDRARLHWLLTVIQAPQAAPARNDLDLFVAGYADLHRMVPRAQIGALLREVRKGLLRFIREHVPWEIKIGGPGLKRRLEWLGRDIVSAEFQARWRDAFLLRVADLLAKFGPRIRACRRVECARLFVAEDNRQVYCSVKCSERIRQQRFRGKKLADKENDDGTQTQRR